METNPRDVKRFFNTVILAKQVFNKPIDKLIVVQAMRFRLEWNKLLDVIIEKKTEFLKAYEKIQDQEGADKKELLLIYPELEKDYPDFFNSNTVLRQFLTQVLDILKNIDDIQEYRRALISVNLRDPGSPIEIEDKLIPTLISSRNDNITRLKDMQEHATIKDRDKLRKIIALLTDLTTYRSRVQFYRSVNNLRNAVESLGWDDPGLRSYLELILIRLKDLFEYVSLQTEDLFKAQ